MSLVSGYDNEIFISYSHIDNEPFGDPRGGWVDIFHEQLQNFVNVHVGRRTNVWRDKRLTGAEVFSNQIEQQLRKSAVLVLIVSPGYMQSEWCNRELVGFTKAAQDQGNLRVGNLQRVVKVLRLPVERSVLPALLDDVLGQQFYRVRGFRIRACPGFAGRFERGRAAGVPRARRRCRSGSLSIAERYGGVERSRSGCSTIRRHGHGVSGVDHRRPRRGT